MMNLLLVFFLSDESHQCSEQNDHAGGHQDVDQLPSESLAVFLLRIEQSDFEFARADVDEAFTIDEIADGVFYEFLVAVGVFGILVIA